MPDAPPAAPLPVVVPRTGGRLRVALAGAGMISAYHLRAWQKLPQVEVVALIDPDAPRLQARADEFGIPGRYDSLDALLAAETIDALDIASPMETHGPLLKQAAGHGVAVLCQKPFMPTFDEATATVDELAKRAPGHRLMVNQNFRFRPYYRQMRRWIDEGRVGDITGLTIACRSSGLVADACGRYPYIERQPFVRTMPRLMITEILTHRLDLARWLCGPLQVVAARVAHTCPALVGESEASLLLQSTGNGSPVVVDGNLACVGMPALSQDRVELIGRLGRITFEADVLRLFCPAPQEIRYDYATAYQDSFDGTIAHFVEALETGAPFLTDAGDNLETLRLVEGAYLLADADADADAVGGLVVG